MPMVQGMILEASKFLLIIKKSINYSAQTGRN